jgi:hypothetical protein
MRGSVVKKNDHWYVVIEDKDPATGRRKRRWHSGYRTKREAQAACNELAVAMQRGEYLAPSKQTVGDFVEEWLDTIRATVRVSTLEKYSRDLRTHVVPNIGFVAMTKLDGPALNRLWSTLAETGKRPSRPGGDRTGLSHKSIENVAMTLHRLLKDAVRWGRIARNPADMADPPKRTAHRRELIVWSAATLRRFLEATADDELFPLWFFLATTGTRRGEALGLRWNDTDLDTKKVKIIQTVMAIGWEIHYGQPKTARSSSTPAPSKCCGRIARRCSNNAYSSAPASSTEISCSANQTARRTTPNASTKPSNEQSKSTASPTSQSMASATPGPRWRSKPGSTRKSSANASATARSPSPSTCTPNPSPQCTKQRRQQSLR